jgi:hypothetical protein
MREYIIFYTLGALISSSWICTWFFSNLPVHLFTWCGLLKKKDEVFTWEEWSEWFYNKNHFFGEMTSCPLCFGFWVSVAVASLITYLNNFPYLFIAAAAFSWPLFIYIFYTLLNKDE